MTRYVPIENMPGRFRDMDTGKHVDIRPEAERGGQASAPAPMLLTMIGDRIRLTREQLHELVWTRPIHQLAAGFGLSDVGFAKICRRLGVPRPGRGHWAKLAAGKNSRRASLPKAQPGTPDVIELQLRPRTEVEPEAQREVPIVTVPEDLRAAHEATRRLNSLLDRKPYGKPLVHVLRGRETATIRVSPESKRRAVLVLDGLFKALEARGHIVQLKHQDEGVPRSGVELHVRVGEEPVAVALIEKTIQKAHVLTREEAERAKRGSFSWAPAYDHFTTGVLAIEIDKRRYGHGARFADGKKQRLEDKLGRVVLAIEDQARTQCLERDARRLVAERAEVERQRQEDRRRQREHMVTVREDLLQMAGRWSEAGRVRGFLEAYEVRRPASERSEAEVAWLAWARRFAEEHDPLTRVEGIAKRLSPTT